jgi:hypothetical protein
MFVMVQFSNQQQCHLFSKTPERHPEEHKLCLKMKQIELGGSGPRLVAFIMIPVPRVFFLLFTTKI